MSGATSPIISFDSVYFALRYPEFSTVPNSLLLAYFTEAGLLVNNSACSIVTDQSIGGALYIWLHMLTAHLAFLYSGANGTGASALVGRINDATQGSVHVSAEMPNQPQSAAYFQQTKYGAEFWQQTAQYRTAQYFPSCRPGYARGYFGRPW